MYHCCISTVLLVEEVDMMRHDRRRLFCSLVTSSIFTPSGPRKYAKRPYTADVPDAAGGGSPGFGSRPAVF